MICLSKFPHCKIWITFCRFKPLQVNAHFIYALYDHLTGPRYVVIQPCEITYYILFKMELFHLKFNWGKLFEITWNSDLPCIKIPNKSQIKIICCCGFQTSFRWKILNLAHSFCDRKTRMKIINSLHFTIDRYDHKSLLIETAILHLVNKIRNRRETTVADTYDITAVKTMPSHLILLTPNTLIQIYELANKRVNWTGILKREN